jgi:hypothetical protein
MKIGHMIGRVISLVRTDGNAATRFPAFGLEHYLRGAALGGAARVRRPRRESAPTWPRKLSAPITCRA